MYMEDLTTGDIKSMGRAIGIIIPKDDLLEVTHTVNAMLAAINGIEVQGVDEVEPLPILRGEALN